MLHLLPIRWLVRIALTVFALAVLSAVYAGRIGSGEFAHDASLIFSWSSIAAGALIVLLYAAWRWVPLVQRLIFPYLGGRWSGYIRYEANGAPHDIDVTMEIKHTLFGLRMLLDSRQSTSITLAVHAERDPDFERYRLYYVYLNERKDGFENAGARYRGLAVISVTKESKLCLHGNYFTDADRRGTLHLTIVRFHPWWKLWR
jgi:predicted pore-forming effector associated with SMODS systems